ncbi:1-acyl-sn-glycerol-3-phosphate acyltransferase [Horticoccus luteus]|uniref:1-acyl-sn-glycerol-3-phosphate acyltransferase n=2 Tax=Horticoccus luteus TaxID=2862869 RepID=A0A8F9U0E0_9BACT|nr:1-acyl-sn-glycerol-3-phosphate acyltransferase [Horticoccus luteus]
MEPVYGFFHYLSTVIYSLAFRGEIVGQENLPATGAFLIASNHASYIDPPVLGSAVPRQLCFFARKTLWKPGIASWWLDTVGTIPVDRDGGQDISALKRVLRTLKENKGLILFPEGTRSPDGNLQPPKAGVGFIVCRSQVPVVPARIFGSFEAFGRQSGLRLGRPISIVFGTPLSPADYDDPADGKERYQRASERIMAAIARLNLPPPVVV